ncbi:MAG: hypothetical protein LBL61_01185 [Elusimicrobiota bacterium]|nr:hypothetical protein [Elusimicrobiota bacterium]
MRKLMLTLAVMLFSLAIFAQENKDNKVYLLSRYDGKKIESPALLPDRYYAAYYEGDKIVSPFIGDYGPSETNGDLNVEIGDILKQTDIYKQNVKPANGANVISSIMLRFVKGNDPELIEKIENARAAEIYIPKAAMVVVYNDDELRTLEREHKEWAERQNAARAALVYINKEEDVKKRLSETISATKLPELLKPELPKPDIYKMDMDKIRLKKLQDAERPGSEKIQAVKKPEPESKIPGPASQNK